LYLIPMSLSRHLSIQAESSCGIYSLIESAKRNGLESLSYLRELFERCLHADSPEDWEKLPPGIFSPLNFTDTTDTRLF